MDVWLTWLLELPRCWVEYSDTQLAQIANATCVAIGYSGEGPSQLWFLLGLLAPKAEWCMNLLVGTALMVVARRLQRWLQDSRMCSALIAAAASSGVLQMLTTDTCVALDRCLL